MSVNVPNTIFHTTAGYIEYCIDSIPNIIGNETRWGFGENNINFVHIADICAQLYKQTSNKMRKWLNQEALKNKPHPGSLEAGGDGDFRNPSPYEFQILLEALINENKHEWSIESDGCEEGFELDD